MAECRVAQHMKSKSQEYYYFPPIRNTEGRSSTETVRFLYVYFAIVLAMTRSWVFFMSKWLQICLKMQLKKKIPTEHTKFLKKHVFFRKENWLFSKSLQVTKLRYNAYQMKTSFETVFSIFVVRFFCKIRRQFLSLEKTESISWKCFSKKKHFFLLKNI